MWNGIAGRYQAIDIVELVQTGTLRDLKHENYDIETDNGAVDDRCILGWRGVTDGNHFRSTD